MNKKIIENCKLIIDFIQSLEDEYVGIYPGINEISMINKKKLPEDFTYFLRWSNGFSLFGTEILGIGNTRVDLIETTKWEQNESNNLMPKYIIPFSPMGNGDFYCFDLKNGLDENGLCPVIYWQWDYSSEEEYETVNSSFIDWLKELIDDSLEDQ